MGHKYIRTPEELREFLKAIRHAEWIAIDTEFVSEGKCRFELCLVQVATEGMVVLIDAIAVPDLCSFWKRLCDEKTTAVVHAGRSELEFCYMAIGQIPKRLFDVQLAAGFLTGDYPQSFKHLGEKILKVDLAKGETRTNWQRRPLSLLQIDYAVTDVCYLHEMAIKLKEMLESKGRYEWYLEEADDFLEGLLVSFSRSPWLRLSGLRNLSSRQLGIVRELFFWRKEEAAQSHRSPGSVLRDDLIIELARRQSADPVRILAVRGLERLRKNLVSISEAIDRALTLDASELPAIVSDANYPQYPVVTQLLQAALAQFAKENQLSILLLAPLHELRIYVARFYGTLPQQKSSILSRGWRSELVGPLLTQLLQGKLAVRLTGKDASEAVELVPLPDDF